MRRLLNMDDVQMEASIFKDATPRELINYYRGCLRDLNGLSLDFEDLKTAEKTRQYVSAAMRRLDKEGEKAIPSLTGPVPYTLPNNMIAMTDRRGRTEILG